MTFVNEGVLLHFVGGEPADGRQRTNSLRRDCGDTQQRQQEDDDEAEDDYASKIAAATLPSQSNRARTRSPGGCAPASERGVADCVAGRLGAQKPEDPGKQEPQRHEDNRSPPCAAGEGPERRAPLSPDLAAASVERLEAAGVC